jgi:serine/threonine protein phosphatase PrpC
MGASLVYLDRPNTVKETITGQSKIGYRFAASCMQGWRLSMEDAHITNVDIGNGIGLFAVFDGHGGIEVAKFCEAHFTQLLISNHHFQNKSYPKALEETFLEMDVLLANSTAELMAIHHQFP